MEQEQNTAVEGSVQSDHISDGVVPEDNAGAIEDSDTPQPKVGKQPRTYTEDDVKEMVKTRLERDRKVQAQKSEEKAAEQRAEWESLAKKRADRIGELEPQVERLEGLEGIVSKYVESEREGIPQHILTLLDAMPVEKQLEYITENREQLKAPVEEPKSRVAPDVSGTNKNGGSRYDKERNQFNNILRVRGLRK